ncbi:hypothetical protein D3C86_1459030 [compost metagenome]
MSRPSSPLISSGVTNWLATATAPEASTPRVSRPVPKNAEPSRSNGRRNHGSSINTPMANHRARRGTSCHQSRPTSHNAQAVLPSNTRAYRPRAARRAASNSNPVRVIKAPAIR